jgi:hypothetical protein
MKKLTLIVMTVALFGSFVNAQTWVDGYTKKDGTYVGGHYRSDRDGTKDNNWSTRGNYNPYTGEKGYK